MRCLDEMEQIVVKSGRRSSGTPASEKREPSFVNT